MTTQEPSRSGRPTHFEFLFEKHTVSEHFFSGACRRMERLPLTVLTGGRWCLAVLFSTPVFAHPVAFPDQLIGKYTFRGQESCGSTVIEKNSLSGEGYSCSLNGIYQVRESDDVLASLKV